jgi:hypothetical protein
MQNNNCMKQLTAEQRKDKLAALETEYGERGGWDDWKADRLINEKLLTFKIAECTLSRKLPGIRGSYKIKGVWNFGGVVGEFETFGGYRDREASKSEVYRQVTYECLYKTT